jgi:DNA-binding NtrC family response regulator
MGDPPGSRITEETMKDFSAPDASILLFDSESVTRAGFRDALESAGYLVVTAADLGEAVDRVAEMRPDLLIIRPYVNSMPGRTAADYLRSKRPGLPVLIVAGFMDDDRVRVQKAIEEFHTFPTPFTRDELVAKVKDVLDIVRKKT